MGRAASSMKKVKTANRSGSGVATAKAAGNHATSALATAKRVLRIEAEAIAGLIERLDGQFEMDAQQLFRRLGGIDGERDLAERDGRGQSAGEGERSECANAG